MNFLTDRKISSGFNCGPWISNLPWWQLFASYLDFHWYSTKLSALFFPFYSHLGIYCHSISSSATVWKTSWMVSRHLTLNPRKTEVIYIPGNPCSWFDLDIIFGNTLVAHSIKAGNLGGWPVILHSTWWNYLVLRVSLCTVQHLKNLKTDVLGQYLFSMELPSDTTAKNMPFAGKSRLNPDDASVICRWPSKRAKLSRWEGWCYSLFLSMWATLINHGHL